MSNHPGRLKQQPQQGPSWASDTFVELVLGSASPANQQGTCLEYMERNYPLGDMSPRPTKFQPGVIVAGPAALRRMLSLLQGAHRVIDVVPGFSSRVA